MELIEIKEYFDDFYLQSITNKETSYENLIIGILGTFRSKSRIMDFEKFIEIDNGAFVLSTLDLINRHYQRERKKPLTIEDIELIYNSFKR